MGQKNLRQANSFQTIERTNNLAPVLLLHGAAPHMLPLPHIGFDTLQKCPLVSYIVSIASFIILPVLNAQSSHQLFIRLRVSMPTCRSTMTRIKRPTLFNPCHNLHFGFSHAVTTLNGAMKSVACRIFITFGLWWALIKLRQKDGLGTKKYLTRFEPTSTGSTSKIGSPDIGCLSKAIRPTENWIR